MAQATPWNKEQYDCMYSHKNLDECCRDFQDKFPKITLSAVFTHWNHKTHYRKLYEKLLVNKDNQHQTDNKTTSIELKLDHRTKKLREILLSLNLHDGQDIPWVILTHAAKEIFSTEGTIRAVMFGYGTYKERKTAKYFKDITSTSMEGKKIFRKPELSHTSSNQILCPDCKNTLVQSGGQLKCNKCGYIKIDETNRNAGIHTITVKTKAITEPIKNERFAAVVDDDIIKLWKYRSLRAEQVQLMKEMVKTNEKLSIQSEQQTKLLSKILESFETARDTQLRRLAEEKEREDKKKNMEKTTEQVTA